MVVVIGPRGPEPAGLWAVAQALGQGTRVIPVLVGRARMPERHELPAELQLLARRQPAMVRDVSFEYDVDRLVGAISRIPPAAHATPSAVELQHLLDRAAWMGIVPAPSLLRPGRGWGVQYERSPDISDAADEWPMERPRPQLRGWRALRAVAFAAVTGGLAYLIADRLLGGLVLEPTEWDSVTEDLVGCTVFAPPAVVVGDSLLVQALVHPVDEADDARALALEMDTDAERRVFHILDAAVRPGSRLHSSCMRPA